ncbi:MAG TPA: hypothetical protein EYO33_07555 [Phycisphaerales bacterium]|nr:hypothetical protein [Phycisphaerales bacterium]
MSDLAKRNEDAATLCSLLAKGRIEEATAVWTNTLDHLGTRNLDGDSESQVYRDLHQRVLDKALDFSQLAFADRILSAIPKGVRQNDSHLKACQRRLTALRLANEGRAVVPMPYLQEGWWCEGPFKLPGRSDSKAGQGLLRWFAARVENVSFDKVELRIAEIPVGGTAEPEILIAAFSLDQVSDWAAGHLTPREGNYWEIGVYREDGKEKYRLAVHEQEGL